MSFFLFFFFMSIFVTQIEHNGCMDHEASSSQFFVYKIPRKKAIYFNFIIFAFGFIISTDILTLKLWIQTNAWDEVELWIIIFNGKNFIASNFTGSKLSSSFPVFISDQKAFDVIQTNLTFSFLCQSSRRH